MKARTRSRPPAALKLLRSAAFAFPLTLAVLVGCFLGEARALSVENWVFGNGGGKARNAVHVVNGTIGQPNAGISTGETCVVASGVWHDTCGILWTGAAEGPEQVVELPSRYALFQNYPNPFNPTSTIEFTLAKRSHVSLKLYNILGEIVAEFVDDDLPAGDHEVIVNGENLPSGVYFYRISAGDFVKTRKLVLLK